MSILNVLTRKKKEIKKRKRNLRIIKEMNQKEKKKEGRLIMKRIIPIKWRYNQREKKTEWKDW